MTDPISVAEELLNHMV